MNKSAFICVILCGVLVACLPRLVAPSDSYISDSLNPVVTDNTFDLFPPFQPVYINSNDFCFTLTVPLDRTAYSFIWSYSRIGSNFVIVDRSDSLFKASYNVLRALPSASNAFYTSSSFYIKCDVFEIGSSNLLHTYYFSYQFFNFPLSQNNSSTSALKAVDSIILLQEEQPQEESQEEQPQEEPQEEQPQEEPKEIEPQEEIEGGEDGE